VVSDDLIYKQNLRYSRSTTTNTTDEKNWESEEGVDHRCRRREHSRRPCHRSGLTQGRQWRLRLGDGVGADPPADLRAVAARAGDGGRWRWQRWCFPSL
jgi:hypothetical protein